MQMITDLEPERPGSGSDPTVGVLSYRIGFLALLGATILGAIGCVYGLLVGTTFGALSPWEWVTVPAMGILCGAFAILLLVTGERHLRRGPERKPRRGEHQHEAGREEAAGRKRSGTREHARSVVDPGRPGRGSATLPA